MSAISTFMAATRPATPSEPATGSDATATVRHAARVLSAIEDGVTTLPELTKTTELSVSEAVGSLDWLSDARLVELSQPKGVLTAELTAIARNALSSS